MIARVAAVRIEEAWDIPGSRVKCLARLTRPLSSAEAKRLENTKVFHANGDVVTYACRPQDSEELAARLEAELGRAARAEPSMGRRRFPSPALP
jgi:hypothetical protein